MVCSLVGRNIVFCCCWLWLVASSLIVSCMLCIHNAFFMYLFTCLAFLLVAVLFIDCANIPQLEATCLTLQCHSLVRKPFWKPGENNNWMRPYGSALDSRSCLLRLLDRLSLGTYSWGRNASNWNWIWLRFSPPLTAS